MKRTSLRAFGCMALLGVLVAAGCGGGGGGGGVFLPPAATSTPVALKFRTYSAATIPPAPGIETVGFRVLLPVGVTVATDPADSKLTASGVLKLSGVFTTTFKNISSQTQPRPLQGSYSTAKPAGSGRNAIRVNLYFNANNPAYTFGPGEFLTVNGTAAPGVVPAKSDFSYSELIIGGALGADITSNYKFDFTMVR
jgi:hypothetical protein